MEGDSPRIDDLRRRVQQDPASIAFAHLAEEHRRAGDSQEAVRVCRAGLEHHPAYLSAHVTLGRALMELEQYPEARIEFAYVLGLAPDNLVALKSMTDLQQRADLKVRPYTENVRSPEDPALEELQGWLAAIEADRGERARAGRSVAQDGLGGSASRNPPYS